MGSRFGDDCQGFDASPLVLNIGGIFWWTDVWLSRGREGGEWDLSWRGLRSDMSLVGDWVLSLELSVRTDDALEDDVVDPVGDSGPIVEAVGDSPPSDVKEARL
jgi:hypothetical protein